jgi:membrane protease YdiL (CAAX protease family)
MSGCNMKNLGLRKDNIISSFPSYFWITLAIVAFEGVILGALIYFADASVYINNGELHIVGGGKSSTLELTAKYLFFEKMVKYGLVFCFFQELLFRGYLVFRLKKYLKNDFIILLIVSILFAFAHIIMNKWIIVLSMLFPGMIWTWVYLKKPNLFNVTVSHFICGIFGVILYRFVCKTNILDIIMANGVAL